MLHRSALSTDCYKLDGSPQLQLQAVKIALGPIRAFGDKLQDVGYQRL